MSVIIHAQRGKKSKQGFLCWFNTLAASKKLTVTVKIPEPHLCVASPSHSQQQHVVLASSPPSPFKTWLVVL